MTDDDVVAYLAGASDTAPGAADRERLDQSRALLTDPAIWVEPSPDLEQRVLAAVANAPRLSATPVGAAGSIVEVPGPGRRRSGHRFRTAVLGAAAAVLLAVGLAAVVTHRDQPVQFAAALQGTELAPAASGSATLTKTSSGWRIHLSANGLPRLDNGSYYQGWLKDAAGTLVPIGTFNEPSDVTLWAGVPPSSYPIITITRQRAGAGPASSGEKVLVGTTHQTH